MKTIGHISRAMNSVAMGVLVAMMLLTTSDVLLRYVFSRPITGATEITELAMVVLTSLGLAWCAVKRGHLKVDLVISRFSPRSQAITDSITHLAGAVICAIIAWRSFLQAISLQQLNRYTSLLDIPIFPFYMVMALGCAILCLVLLTHFIEHVAKAVKA